MKKNNSTSAEAYFNKSVKEDANFCPSYYQLGLIQYGRKQFNSALKNFKEATLGTCYDSPAAHYYQGSALIGLKRYNDARMKFDEIDARFKKSEFATKARMEMMELNHIEKNSMTEEAHATSKLLESPNF